MSAHRSASRPLAIALVVGVALVAGCGGGGSSAPKGTATVTNGTVNVTANSLAFDVGTIDAQGGAAFTIHFTNAESVPHNIAVYPQSGDAISKGQVITGPSATDDLQVPALEPGTYPFRCDVHPQQMTGTIVVASGGAASPAPTSPAASSPPAPS